MSREIRKVAHLSGTGKRHGSKIVFRNTLYMLGIEMQVQCRARIKSGRNKAGENLMGSLLKTLKWT
jgi:hypothetical protein